MGDPYAEFQQPSAPDPYADFQSAAPPAPPATPGEAKQSVYQRLTSGYDPGAAAFDEQHPIIGKGVRAMSAVGGAVLGLPGNIFHAVVDPLTPEEEENFKGHTRIPGEVAVERLTGGEAAVSAGKDYASGKVSPSAALSVLPEALGSGVGTVAGSEIAGAGLSKVGQFRASAKGVQPLARKITGVETAVKEEVGKTAEKQAGVLEKNKADRLETVRGNLAKQRAANTDITRDKMAIGEKNKAIEASNKAQAEQVARRGELAKTVDQQSNQLGEHISKVEASVGREANQKFDAVREKLGISEGNPGPEIAPDPLVDTVRNIEDNVLQGIPEHIKEFRAILGHGEEAPEGLRGAFKEATGEEPLGGKPFTWDQLQSLKSRIDARLRKSRGMNGDLKRGLYQARDAVVNTMGEIAGPAGAGDAWADAKDFYRQYKEDFHEPTGPSGSGSPVAQALDAVDPKNIRQPFLRTQATTGNRATEILRKYPQHGGTEAATHAEGLIKSHQEMMGLPEKLAPKALKQYPESHQMPTPKEAPRIPEAPTVDINKVAKEAIAAKAKNWGSFNARDVGIIGSSVVAGLIAGQLERGVVAALGFEGTKFGAARLLNKPAVIDWLAKTPPGEIAAINKIPGADKVRVVDGLTDAAVEAAKAGKLTRISPEVRRLIGPANVARIMAVTGATQVSTPGEAKDRARQFAPASN